MLAKADSSIVPGGLSQIYYTVKFLKVIKDEIARVGHILVFKFPFKLINFGMDRTKTSSKKIVQKNFLLITGYHIILTSARRLAKDKQTRRTREVETKQGLKLKKKILKNCNIFTQKSKNFLQMFFFVGDDCQNQKMMALFQVNLEKIV